MDEKRVAWLVLVPGRQPFPMVGEPRTHDEAIAWVQSIWPDADVWRYA